MILRRHWVKIFILKLSIRKLGFSVTSDRIRIESFAIIKICVVFFHKIMPTCSPYRLYKELEVKVYIFVLDQDGAEPSGNSVAATNLMKLSSFVDKKEYREKAAKIYALFEPRLSKMPHALPQLLASFILYSGTQKQVGLVVCEVFMALG